MATTNVTWKDAGDAAAPNFAGMGVGDTMNLTGKLASVNRVLARVGRSQFGATTGVLKTTYPVKTYSAVIHPTKTATILVKRLT